MIWGSKAHRLFFTLPALFAPGLVGCTGLLDSAGATFESEVEGGDPRPVSDGSMPAAECLASTWPKPARIVPEYWDTNDRFGSSLALDGDRLAIGAPGDDSEGVDPADNGLEDSGAVHVYERRGKAWESAHFLKAAAPRRGGELHELHLKGDLLVVSEPGPFDWINLIPLGEGLVHTFTFDGASWPSEPALRGFDAGVPSGFGSRVKTDGTRLVAGAPADASGGRGVSAEWNDTSAPGSGAVYVYVRDGNGWALEAYIKASNARAGDGFGWSLALSGNTLVVGAPFESGPGGIAVVAPDEEGTSRSGAAYIFTRGDDGKWVESAYIKQIDPHESYQFGASVSLYGETLVVGEPATFTSARGEAYLYRGADQAWRETEKIDGPDSFGGVHAVSGDTLFMAAPSHQIVRGYRVDEGVATPCGVVTGERDTWFGWSMAADGRHLAIGSPREPLDSAGMPSDRGAVYVYEVGSP